MKRPLFALLAIVALTLSSVSPLLAQEGEPDGPIYLPLVITQDDDDGGSGTIPSALPEETLENGLLAVEVSADRVDSSRIGDLSAADRVTALDLNTAQLDAARMDATGITPSKLQGSFLSARGQQRVIINLAAEPLAVVAANSVSASDTSAQSILDAQAATIAAQQQDVLAIASSLDANVELLGQVSKALNAVMLNVDAAALPAIAANPNVVSIHYVQDYELDLDETVPYIGAAAVQEQGFDGSGVTVAVLDSGIDYTHASLGGSGDVSEYENNDPRVIEGDSFPTDKVVAGFDFVGSNWPGFDVDEDGQFEEIEARGERPDPDPLDDGPEAGHGTHVAAIIGGERGVAPGVDLHAVKVCSSVSTSCSGVALILAMDYVLDPDADGSFEDAVDIVNMSLGSSYGLPFDDDLSQAVENASLIGVLTVASAGNSADKPYITGSPAAAPSALSVAQTQVPSAVQAVMQVLAPEAIAGDYAAVFQPWSVPLGDVGVVEAPVVYGNGNGGNLNGCEPFDVDLSGFIVLVDRGACNFTLKAVNITLAGGELGIIGLVAPGEPFSGGDGGDSPIEIPVYMISQDDANALKAGLPDTVVRFDPARGIPLVGSLVGSSSRGPSMQYDSMIKPEIGAPGASISAIAGSGTETGPFGGTSGAAPMVAGSAALLVQAHPDRPPAEIKNVLINTAETDIKSRIRLGEEPDTAEITRVGGGEVRVDHAVDATAAAWDNETGNAAISLGFDDFTTRFDTMTRTILIRNYSNQTQRFTIEPEFRSELDEMRDAVRIRTRDQISVPANSSRTFDIEFQVLSVNLPEWTLNSGSNGADGELLTDLEFDGWIFLRSDQNDIHLPWHILPRQGSRVRLFDRGDFIRLVNYGLGEARVETYSLIASSGNLPEGDPGTQSPQPDFRYVGYATFPVPAGFCGPNDSFVMQFAVNSWERTTHANAPASYEFDLDVDRDGTFDYAVFNFPLGFAFDDGRNVTYVQDLETGASSAFFFTDHITNSANNVLTFCGDQIGLDIAAAGQPIDMQGFAVDFYFGDGGAFGGGAVTDETEMLTIAPLGERYLGLFEEGGIGTTTLPYQESDNLSIIDTGSTVNSSESGLLILFQGGAEEDEEAAVITIEP